MSMGWFFSYTKPKQNSTIGLATHQCFYFYFYFNKSLTFSTKFFLTSLPLAEHTKEAKHKSSNSKKWVIMNHCKKSCKTCKDTTFQNFFKSTITDRNYLTINPTNQYLNCSSKNIIYLITCSQCGVQYVGQTKNNLNRRRSSHRSAIK